MIRIVTSFLSAALLAALVASSSYAAVPVQLIHAAAPVVISTVSARAKERINDQIPPNARPTETDASLEKSAIVPGYTVIPLPAFVFNRNEGAWFGGLVPIFRANARGQIEDIYAPLYLHNDIIGETFAFNYFGYRKDTRQYHLIVSYATKIERFLDYAYKDTGVGDGRYIVWLQGISGKTAFNRFYGFGNRANIANESNYTLGDTNLKASVGVNLGHSLSLLGTERYRRVKIENGAVASLPQTLDRFPSAPGIDGAEIWAQAVTLTFDSRDNPLTPLRGTNASASVESAQNYRSNNRGSWWHVTGEVRNYLPHREDRAVLVTHALIDALPNDSRGLVRQGVPFYERPSLGGEFTLRGFGRGRYVSNYAVLFNIEERLSVLSRSIMGNVVELEVAPFLDFGRVGREWASNRLFSHIQFNPGVGVRFLARPNIAGRLDVATGRDGPAVFVGLDYPF